MLSFILFSVAAAGNPPSTKPITIIDDSPRIIIPLAAYDLGRAEDVVHVKHRIVTAAKMVCERGIRGIAYLETVACVKSAVADGNAQLGRILAQNPSATGVAAAIAVSAPDE
jgi:UrcA family protein